ncbi:hypothetical protein PPH41_20840, partial [Burkholderia gladioli]|nr:hypothetical protein [Burkholderia gladioli]
MPSGWATSDATAAASGWQYSLALDVLGAVVERATGQPLAATLNALEFLLSQLGYDHAHPRVLARAEALHGRMQLFMPLMP